MRYNDTVKLVYRIMSFSLLRFEVGSLLFLEVGKIKTADSFYKTSKWQRVRKKSLREHKYLCQETLRYGRNVEAEMVHHIYPRLEYPELAYEPWNLLPVTNKRHNTFHNRNDDSLTEKGKYWQEKRKKEFNAWIKKHPPTF